MKKIIYPLVIVFLLELIFTTLQVSASSLDIQVPQSYTEPGEAFNQLLDGQATITSDDEDSSEKSQVLGIGDLNEQADTAAEAVTSVSFILPFCINKIMSFLVTGGEAVIDDNPQSSEYFTIGNLLMGKYPIFDINMFSETPDGPNSDISNNIKNNVAPWYVAVRNISVVGCAIVLIYVGIRMALSTTAEDSAKYKKMLLNWLIGVILLFVMQYIVLAMIKLSEIFIDFIKNAVETDTDTTDMELILLTGIPVDTYNAKGWGKLVYLSLNCVFGNKEWAARKQPICRYSSIAQSRACPAEPRTSMFLCMYIFLSSSLAGPRYFLGSNSAGFSARTFLTIAVIARRPSESTLILQTADAAAFLSCSSGIPTLSASFPPYWLMIFTYSCGTEDDPWRTIGNPGILLSISSRISKRSGGGTRTPSAFLVHCAAVNLYAPWLVPMEIASESTPVRFEKSSTSSGFV